VDAHENFFRGRYGTSSGFALENTLPDYLYNVGTGEDLTIKQLAETIRNNNTRRNHLGINRMVH
jgi:predicted DNA-binding ribbon-helix-helix protein